MKLRDTEYRLWLTLTLVAALFIMHTANQFAQMPDLPEGRIGQVQKYDPKNRPTLVLPDAYSLALGALGNETNQFYCISASCLNRLENFGGGVLHQMQLGWTFEFSSTNGTQRHVLVYFDKSTAVGRTPAGF